MISAIVVVFLALTNVVHRSQSVQKLSQKWHQEVVSEKNFIEDTASKKLKRWAPNFQDIALDYPEFDEAYGDAVIESAKPFGASAPGSVLLYQSGSRRPSGAVTRTVFDPPSGFIPRVLAAAKAAFATLTGPQTILSRTTYLRPPRPALTALQVPSMSSSPGGTSTTNSAAVAAATAAAVAAVTRSIYEAAEQRGTGFISDKGVPLHRATYSNYGIWPEPSRSTWTSLTPPEISVRIPQGSWGPRPNQIDSYGQPVQYGPPPMFHSQPYEPPPTNYNPIITIEPPKNTYTENHYLPFNKVSHNHIDGWNSGGSYKGDTNYNIHRNRVSWSQEKMKDSWFGGGKSTFGRGSGGYGGYAAATADTPPNGDSFADAKINAKGASAIAAAIWTQADLGGGFRSSVLNGEKRTKTGNSYSQSANEDDFARTKLGDDNERVVSRNLSDKHNREDLSGRTEDVELSDDNGTDSAEKIINQLRCQSTDRIGGCSLPRTNAEILRALFSTKRNIDA